MKKSLYLIPLFSFFMCGSLHAYVVECSGQAIVDGAEARLKLIASGGGMLPNVEANVNVWKVTGDEQTLLLSSEDNDSFISTFAKDGVGQEDQLFFGLRASDDELDPDQDMPRHALIYVRYNGKNNPGKDINNGTNRMVIGNKEAQLSRTPTPQAYEMNAIQCTFSGEDDG